MSLLSSAAGLVTGAGKAAVTGGISLLANLKNYIIAGLLVASLGAGALAVWRGHQMDVLNHQVTALQATIKADQQYEKAQSEAMAELGKRDAERLKRQKSISTIKQEAENAPSSEDGAIAPVLRDTLSRLDGLRLAHRGTVHNGASP